MEYVLCALRGTPNPITLSEVSILVNVNYRKGPIGRVQKA
jgi:hypothetical protein